MPQDIDTASTTSSHREWGQKSKELARKGVRRVLAEYRKGVRRVLAEYRGEGVKNFRGNLWDRIRGLEFLFEHVHDTSLLDITSSEGLISYEFARHGASLIHGFDHDRNRVRFCRRLFRDVPIKSHFEIANLAVSGTEFATKFQQILLPQYDIVLFLGAYHHLRKQLSFADLNDLVSELIRRTRKYIALRTGRYKEPEQLILAEGFRLVHAPIFENQGGGPLRIYERL